MGRPFSAQVGEATWRAEVIGWIEDQVAAGGRRLLAEPDQVRIRPWSTQLTADTDQGRLWFKANCAPMAFEAALHDRLATWLPDAVDRPYAVVAERGWMLTADRGTTLGEQAEPTLKSWQGVLAGAARMQRGVAERHDEMVALGVPDCAPPTVVDRFDRLLAMYAELPTEHPAHVPHELRQHLLAARPRLADAAARLQESRLPATWQHGDLHPWNVFVVADPAQGSRIRLFDFGDSQWAHALESLAVPFAWVDQRTSLSWPAVLEAYADAWDVPASLLSGDLAAAMLTQAVNRSLLWWLCLADATADEWREWGEGPVYHLSRVLDP